MKCVLAGIDYVFDTDSEKINSIVIENQNLMFSVLTDVYNQTIGVSGKSVLSQNNVVLPINKKLEIIDDFIGFSINTKTLVGKIATKLEEKALSDDFINDTTVLIGNVDSLLTNISFDLPCDIQFTKMNIGSLIKAVGLEICDEYDSISEKLIDYFKLVNEFCGNQLFVTVNLRSFISDNEAELIMESILLHNIDVLMIECYEHSRIPFENRLIVDSDLCLIK